MTEPRAGDELSGRVALVTGGARGLGASIAFELAAAGATVAVSYLRSRERATSVAEAIGGSAWQADVRDERDSRRLVDSIVEAHGSLDVVVSNAGIWHGGRIDRITSAEWGEVIDTSLGGAFNVARHAVPVMRERQFGRIVAIGSAVGLIGYPGDTPYAAAKAGLVGFARALAKEVGRHGITVNVVAPGPVLTEMTAQVDERSWQRMQDRVVLEGEGKPEHTARAVRFLAADAEYMTGQVLVVDGGFSL